MNQNYIETETIKALLEKYFDAVYRADIDTLKTIFHKEASLNGYLGENMVFGSPQVFFDDLSSQPSMAEQDVDCRCVIKNLDVVGNIAQATLFVDGFFGAFCVQDCFHLMKDQGEWKIICKTFTTL